MSDELCHRPSDVPLAEGINRSRHSSLIDRTKRSASAFGIRRPERYLHDAEAGLVQQPSHLPTPLPIPGHYVRHVAAVCETATGRDTA